MATTKRDPEHELMRLLVVLGAEMAREQQEYAAAIHRLDGRITSMTEVLSTFISRVDVMTKTVENYVESIGIYEEAKDFQETVLPKLEQRMKVKARKARKARRKP